jgi:hypothetical protein
VAAKVKDFTLLAPIALSAACNRLAALRGPFCATAGTTIAVDANSNIPILCLMRSSHVMPKRLLNYFARDEAFGHPGRTANPLRTGH